MQDEIVNAKAVQFSSFECRAVALSCGYFSGKHARKQRW